MPRSPFRRRGIAAAVFVIGVSFAIHARADAPRVLFVAHAASAFSARMRAEIEAMGFTIEDADALPSESPLDAVAAARIIEDPPPRRVELWIVETTRGDLALRAVIQPSADDDEAIQTVRASEQLRALLQPLRASAAPSLAPPTPRFLPPAQPVAEPARLPPAAPRPAEQSPRFVAIAGFALPLQSGGPGLDFIVRARWMATSAIGLGAIGALPIAGSTVSATEGSARVSAALFGPEVTAVVLETPALRLAATAGLALAWLRAEGSATGTFVGQTDSTVTGLPLLGLELAPRIAAGLRLVISGDVAIAVPRADIVFAGHTVATWAWPLGILSCGASLDF